MSALEGEESLPTHRTRSGLLSYFKYRHLVYLWCPKASETSALGWQSWCDAHALRAWCGVVAGGRLGCLRASHMGLQTGAWTNKPTSDVLSRFPWSILGTETPGSQDTLNCLNRWTEYAFGVIRYKHVQFKTHAFRGICTTRCCPSAQTEVRHSPLCEKKSKAMIAYTMGFFQLGFQIITFCLRMSAFFFPFSDVFWNLYCTLSKFPNALLEKHTKLWVFNGKMHICLFAYAFYVKRWACF